MSTLTDLINTSGDEAKEFIKINLIDLIQNAKSESETLVKETGEKIEQWLTLKVNNEIDNDELEALLNSRRRTIKQFLNTEEIRTKARIEKITIGLIDHVLNNAIGRII